MQDFYQLIHEDYLTCAIMVRGRTRRQFYSPMHTLAGRFEQRCRLESAKTTRPIDIIFTRICREIKGEQIYPFRMFLR